MKTGYRIFLTTVFLVAALESTGVLDDPLVQWGFNFQSDLTAVVHIHIIVSVFEICIVLALLCWFLRGAAAKRTLRLERGTLIRPLLVFAALLAFGVLYGQVQPGANLTEALWEVRGFLMMIAGYFLIGMYIRNDAQANQLVWVLLGAATVLTLNNLWIPIAYPAAMEGNDLAYDHADSVVLGLAMILCITILTYGGTRNQRRFAMAMLPVFLICLMIMKRRAAFPVVGLGIIVVIIFLLRLRPRLFWKYVPPLVLLCAAYLGAFWNNTGALGQPARAISSQFNPDPRDYASNLYRDVEKANIVANISASPLTGLGFGQAYHFYFPMVADLSAIWPFWHYETHNAILWIWMKDGAVGFIVFWWLLGRGMFDGSRVVETQREEWALAQYLRKRFAREQRKNREGESRVSTGVFQVALRANEPYGKRGRRKSTAGPALLLNVPAWERSDHKHSVTTQRSATLALLVTAVCMIPMQVVYSYVDLGIVNERDMLLFGLMLGLIARGQTLLGTRTEGKRKRTARKPAVTISAATASEETHALARRVLLLPLGRTRFPTVKSPTSRPSSRPLTGGLAPSRTTQPLAEQRTEPAPAPESPSPVAPTADAETQPGTSPGARPTSARGTTSRPLPRRTTAAPGVATASHAGEPPLPWETARTKTASAHPNDDTR